MRTNTSSHLVEGSPAGAGVVAGVVVLLALVAACDTDVTLVTGSERAFSLYGVLSPDLDTQWVRVFPIEERLQSANPALLEARFTSTDLASGEVVVWTDSLVREPGGRYGHVFGTSVPVAYDRAYRLQVEDLETGVTTWAEVDVPPPVELVTPPAGSTLPWRFDASAVGGAPRIVASTFVVALKYMYAADLDGPEPRIRRRVDTLDVTNEWEREGDVWNLQLHRSSVIPDLGPGLAGMVVVRVRLRVIVGSADWNPPGGVFDLEVLVEPGTLTNVENGFGFVGGGFSREATWIPLDTLLWIEK